MSISETEVTLSGHTTRLQSTAHGEFDQKSASSPLIVNKSYMRFKLLADRLVALFALILLSPFLIIVAVLIRLDSPGPALFRQRRIGFGNQEFVCLKFRTMQVNSHRFGDRESAITQTQDPRVTRIGRILRRTRLDELPQMLNILRGEMSWIGPRPEATELSHWYEEHLPNYRQRFLVRPGITGLAQVRQGHVAGIDATSIKLAHDLAYVRDFSLTRDLKIAVATLLILATGYGSK